MDTKINFEEKELSIFNSLNANNDLIELEKYISVSNNKEYIKVIDKLKISKYKYEDFLKSNKITEEEFQIKQETGTEGTFVILDNNFFYIDKENIENYNKYREEINNSNIQKRKFFIIKEDKKDEYKEIINNFYNHIISGEKDINKFLLKEIDLTKKIYKCYLSDNEKEHNKIINNYYPN